MKRFLLSIFIFSFTVAAAFAQDPFEKFKQFSQQSKQTFETAEQRQKKAYLEFRDKLNEEFAEQMTKDWKSYGAKAPEKKKKEPEVVPVVKPEGEPAPKENVKNEITEVVSAPKPEPPTVPVIPFLDIYVEEEPFDVVEDFLGKWDDDLKVAPLQVPAPGFEFYGTTCRIRYPSENRFSVESTNNNTLSRLWKRLSKKDFDVVIFDCLKVKKALDLCDWGYIQMVHKFAGTIFPGQDNETAYLTFYILTQSGYKLRLSKDIQKSRLHVLVGVDGSITGRLYWVFDGVKFVDIDSEKVPTLLVCDIKYGNESPAKLAITSSNKFRMKATELRKFESKYDNLKTESTVNANLLDFYNDYPNFYLDDDPYSSWKYYAQTPLTESTKAVLYPALKEAVDGKPVADAVNMILHFVQTAFDYKYDEDVWGGERVFFGEETLHYPYCDCEDRAILYSILVRDILGLDVVLVYYPGHLAAATRLEDGTGDYYEVDGNKYFVTDPTFINGCIGDTMTSVRGLGAAIIRL